MPPAQLGCALPEISSASHDGIGMRPAERGEILPEQDKGQIYDAVRAFGGADLDAEPCRAAGEGPYELNITWVRCDEGHLRGAGAGCSCRASYCSQTILIGARGASRPSYIHALSWRRRTTPRHGGKKDGAKRSINRHRGITRSCARCFSAPTRWQARRFRRSAPDRPGGRAGLPPHATRFTLQLDDRVFGCGARASIATSRSFALHNVSGEALDVPVGRAQPFEGVTWHDIPLGPSGSSRPAANSARGAVPVSLDHQTASEGPVRASPSDVARRAGPRAAAPIRPEALRGAAAGPSAGRSQGGAARLGGGRCSGVDRPPGIPPGIARPPAARPPCRSPPGWRPRPCPGQKWRRSASGCARRLRRRAT